jgi:hypothetical protein
VQTEDLGDNAMKAGEYGIRNLRRIVPRLNGWTHVPNEGYKNLQLLYSGVVEQFNGYISHVLSYIGGTYETIKSSEQTGPVYRTVPAALQRDALDFLNRQVLQPPTWLLDTVILARTGQDGMEIIEQSQEMVINTLLSEHTLSDISAAEAMYPAKAYPLLSYLNEVDRLMWTELTDRRPINLYRRHLQRYYVDKLIDLSKKSNEANDVDAVVRNKLEELTRYLKKALPKMEDDPMTQYHLRYLVERLGKR